MKLNKNLKPPSLLKSNFADDAFVLIFIKGKKIRWLEEKCTTVKIINEW